jgi:nucleoredoxin
LQTKSFPLRLYFSAHWCPPCRAFTPRLAEAYSAHIKYLDETSKADGAELTAEQTIEDVGEIEVIFVSLDSVLSEYDNYRSSMPWYSVPHSNLWQMNIKDNLTQKYGVRSIPTLVVLNGESGDVVTRNGKGEYAGYFKGDYQAPSSGCVMS